MCGSVSASLSLFLLFFYGVGYMASRKTASDEDFYAAGFSIGPVTNGLGMAATWASLATFLGVIALIQKLQVPFVYLWIQWAISIPLLTLLYGTSLRRMKAFTPASFIKARYGKGATITIVCWHGTDHGHVRPGPDDRVWAGPSNCFSACLIIRL